MQLRATRIASRKTGINRSGSFVVLETERAVSLPVLLAKQALEHNWLGHDDLPPLIPRPADATEDETSMQHHEEQKSWTRHESRREATRTEPMVNPPLENRGCQGGAQSCQSAPSALGCGNTGCSWGGLSRSWRIVWRTWRGWSTGTMSRSTRTWPPSGSVAVKGGVPGIGDGVAPP